MEHIRGPLLTFEKQKASRANAAMFPHWLEIIFMQKYTTTYNRGKVSTPSAAFAGSYQLEGQSGNYFLNAASGLLVKVCERKEHTPLRPRLYLMHRTSEGGFRYLTGLYPLSEPDTYRAELNGLYYLVTVTPEALNIRGL